MGCRAGYIGPVNVSGTKGAINVIADRAVPAMSDFVCGANEKGFHLTGVNWDRDQQAPQHVYDLRKVKEGDPSPDGKGNLRIARGIEVGHIFQLGTKYSEAMQATVLNEEGKSQVLIMGCYGIGVNRILAAAIEREGGNDENGIIWPASIAPYAVLITVLKWEGRAREVAEKLATDLERGSRVSPGLTAENVGDIDVLIDDRDERPGVKFKDADLIGIPVRVTVGEKGLAEGKVEIKARNGSNGPKGELVAVEDAAARVIELLRSL
jgi:prolyl-tRNA synthetase